MNGAVAKAQELAREINDAVIPQQFENPANPEIHRRTTAEEIWNDTDGAVDVVVSGVGTGGTITGVGQVLKAKKPAVKMIAVEPEDVRSCSPAASRAAQDPGHRRRLRARHPRPQGDRRGDDRRATKTAFETARALARVEGIPVGISSGAAVAAALQLGARPEMAGKMIVVIIPAFAERYLSTALFDGL